MDLIDQPFPEGSFKHDSNVSQLHPNIVEATSVGAVQTGDGPRDPNHVTWEGLMYPQATVIIIMQEIGRSCQ